MRRRQIGTLQRLFNLRCPDRRTIPGHALECGECLSLKSGANEAVENAVLREVRSSTHATDPCYPTDAGLRSDLRTGKANQARFTPYAFKTSRKVTMPSSL
jgi:hypothetical protein